MSEAVAAVALIAVIACRFIFKNGPCGNCGRKWAFGWMATNVMGYCGYRCWNQAMRTWAAAQEGQKE